MKKTLPELAMVDKEAIPQLLHDMCVSTETTDYQKDLTREELNQKREMYTDNNIFLHKKAEEVANFKATIKLQTKPKEAENTKLLSEISSRKQTVVGTLYNIPDHDEGVMDTYDETGEWVGSRYLKPEEKQGRLFVAGNTLRSGTNN